MQNLSREAEVEFYPGIPKTGRAQYLLADHETVVMLGEWNELHCSIGRRRGGIISHLYI